MKHLYLTFALVILAISAAGFVYWRYFFLATVAIDPVPGEAVISVNGQPKVDRTLKLPPGKYDIKVAAEGYRSQQFPVKVGYGTVINKRVELLPLPKPKLILTGPIGSTKPTSDKKEIFFEQKGVLYRYPLTEALPPVAIPITPAIADLERINWSPAFDLALISKKGGETGLYDFKRYDLLRQEYRPLGSNLGATLWKEDGKGFFAEDRSAGRLLTLANRAGTGSSVVLDLTTLPIEAWQLQHGPANILILSEAAANKTADIMVVDTYQKSIAPITDSLRAIKPVLNPTKSRLAYLDNNELVTSEVNGQNKRNHGLRPKPGNYTFIDEMNLAVFSPNLVTIINTGDGTKTEYEIYALSDAIDGLFADPSGKILYYTFDGNLYQINFRP